MSFIGSALHMPKDFLFSNLPTTKAATAEMRVQWESLKPVIKGAIISSPTHTIKEKKNMLNYLFYKTGNGQLSFRRMCDKGRQTKWLEQLIHTTRKGVEHTGHKVTGGGIDAKIAVIFVTSHREADIDGSIYILFQK